ncbi:MAG: hypothetical protein RIE56_10815 [Amphiplicatus sp.]
MILSRLKTLDLRTAAFAGAAALCLAAPAHARDFDWDDEEDFLEDLIEMDAEDIAEMRSELAEARADIADGIRDIEEAKKEAAAQPMSGAFVKAAFAAASAGVSAGVDGLDEAFKAIDRAEATLKERRAELGEAEYRETSDALAMLRTELAGIQAGLEDLAAEMKKG